MVRLIARPAQLFLVGLLVFATCVSVASATVSLSELIAYYPFDGTFQDYSGNGLDANPGAGDPTRSPTFNWSDQMYGAAADFEADARQFLEVLHRPRFSGLDNLTIALWLKPESWDGARRVLQKGDDPNWRLTQHGVYGGPFRFENNQRIVEVSDTPSFLPVGQWNHVAAVFDGDNDVLSLYKNGQQAASTSLSPGDVVDPTNKPLYIGTKNQNAGSHDSFDGLMDEFYIFGRALTSDEIVELMNDDTILPPPPPPPPPNLATLEIEALIDGRDQLIIKGDTLQWEHLDYQAVGRFRGANEPTIINTTLGGAPLLQDVHWIPEWSLPPPDRIEFHDISSAFSALSPPLPEAEQIVSLTRLAVRSGAYIVQQPSEANDYTLVVEFNDNGPAAAATYWVQLDFYAVPEPSTFSLAVLGLVAAALYGWRCKRR